MTSGHLAPGSGRSAAYTAAWRLSSTNLPTKAARAERGAPTRRAMRVT